ncbi:unnamed protein product, partial [Meganyctiphanes norvegica]
SVMKQTGQCHRGQKCYFTHYRQTQNSSMTSRAENQRTFNNSQTWGKTPSTYQNSYNQQWQPNMRHHNSSNQYNENNQMRGPNMDFFQNQNINWQAMTKPIMERAAEILAEKMWAAANDQKQKRTLQNTLSKYKTSNHGKF